jgi:hypothetical protein
MHTHLLSENLKGRDHAEDLGIGEKIIILDCIEGK